MNLLHKKALVTGSSRGIGKAIVLQLAKEGAEVVVHYHKNKTESEAVVRDIKDGGGKAHLLQADLFDLSEAIRLGEEAWDILGGMDVLINNAGVSYKKHFLDTTIEDLEYFININFKSTLLLTRTIAKKMVTAGVGGAIYTITSINGIQPGVGFSVYGATKGALETLMKGVALELAPHNIRVNTLAVGAVETEINAEARQDKEIFEAVTNSIPMGRFGKPEEVASLISNLLAADSYMTGSTIRMDGGWLLKTGYQKPKAYPGGNP
jgi:NAD(P)-dependent dehydrogenase (short-subunit alcohol dehydrogenase family)